MKIELSLPRLMHRSGPSHCIQLETTIRYQEQRRAVAKRCSSVFMVCRTPPLSVAVQIFPAELAPLRVSQRELPMVNTA